MQATLRTDAMMPVALSGTSFGVDFNPVPDRLRVVSDTGQSLRVNVDDGVTIVDAMLNPAPGLGVTAVGYTNNDADMGTATVLYDINTMTDQLLIQAPPNAGTLNPVGTLGVDVGLSTGFDIFSLIQGGRAVQERGLATLALEGGAQLFRVNLSNGRMTAGGTIEVRREDLTNRDDDRRGPRPSRLRHRGDRHSARAGKLENGLRRLSPPARFNEPAAPCGGFV
jgi:hypothetical protein